VLAGADQQLVLLAPQSEEDEARLRRYLLAGHVDGVLLVSLHGADPLPVDLAAAGVPVVIGGRSPSEDITYVDVDNVRGALSAVRHLARLGRRRIATITGPLDMASAADRLEGYRRGLHESALEHDPALEVSGGFEQEAARMAMADLLTARPAIDAVFAASDLMAVGALQGLRRAGKRVPEDVALVGYDDSDLALSTDPPLSSVRQPIEEMGRAMAQLLLATVTERQHVARRVVLATELIVRASSGGDAAA
jgi:DNA-binding LacI/PurR family transcriptional regulator